MFVTQVPRKGHSETEVVVELFMDCIIELSYGNSKIIIKNDQEPLIKTVIELVVQRRVNLETLLEESPKGSSQSNGAAEIAVQQAQGRIRPMILALEQNFITSRYRSITLLLLGCACTRGSAIIAFRWATMAAPHIDVLRVRTLTNH